MDDAKRELKLLLDSLNKTYGSKVPTDGVNDPIELTPKDVNFVVKVLEKFKHQFSHFTPEEENYLMPLMALCAHVLSTEVLSGSFPRSQLEAINDSLLYTFQFLLKVLSNFSVDVSLYEQFDLELFKNNAKAQTSPINSDEFYNHFVKYRLVSFVISLMDDQKHECFFTLYELYQLAQMLSGKPVPNSLRLYQSDNDSVDNDDGEGKEYSPAKSDSSDSPPKKRSTGASVSTSKLSKDIFNTLTNPLPLGSIVKEDIDLSFKSLFDLANNVQVNQINRNHMFFYFSKSGNIFANLVQKYTLVRPFIKQIETLNRETNPLQILQLPATVDEHGMEIIVKEIERDIDLINEIFEICRFLEPLTTEKQSELFTVLQGMFHCCFTLLEWYSQFDRVCYLIEEPLVNIIQKSIKAYEHTLNRIDSGSPTDDAILKNQLKTVWIVSDNILRMMNDCKRFIDNDHIRQCHPFILFLLEWNSLLFDNFYFKFSDMSKFNHDDYDSITKEMFQQCIQHERQIQNSEHKFMHETYQDYSIEEKFKVLYNTIVDWMSFLFLYMDICLKNAHKYKEKFVRYEIRKLKGHKKSKSPTSASSSPTSSASSSSSSASGSPSNSSTPNSDSNQDPDKFIHHGRPAEESHLSLADVHYKLVNKLLNYLDRNYFYPNFAAIQPFKGTIGDQYVRLISRIIKVLDQSLYFTCDVPSTDAFQDFGLLFIRLVGNMISLQILDDQKQQLLLEELGFLSSNGGKFQLYQGAISLVVGGRIIFLQQQFAKENVLKIDLNCYTIKVWRGITNCLQEHILESGSVDCPDFNVEYAQLSLYLFHGLELIQRREVFRIVVQSIHSIGEHFRNKRASTNQDIRLFANQLLLLNRLLHLFEYLLRNLYEAPKYLFEQVSHNIMLRHEFSRLSYNNNTLKNFLSNDKTLSDLRYLKFFNDDAMEIDLLKCCSQRSNHCGSYKYIGDYVTNPKFYYLFDDTTKSLKSGFNFERFPKLDGFACSTLLSGFGELTYAKFYESIFTIFDVIGLHYDTKSVPLTTAVEQSFIDIFRLSVTAYIYKTMWRLMNQLVPTVSSLKTFIDAPIGADISPSKLVNYSIWLPRFESSQFLLWILENNCKQWNSSVEDKSVFYNSMKSDVEQIIQTSRSLDFNLKLFNAASLSFFNMKDDQIQILASTKPDSDQATIQTDDDINRELKAIDNLKQHRFYNFFAFDLFLERFMMLIEKELFNNVKEDEDKQSSGSKSASQDADNQEMIFDQILQSFIGLFQKIFDDFNVYFCYTGNREARTPNDDFIYLINRSIMNILAKHNKIEVNFLEGPVFNSQKAALKFFSLYGTLEPNSKPYVDFTAGSPIEIPLFEIDQKTVANAFTGLLLYDNRVLMTNLEYLNKISDICPEAVTWIKAKQFWIKLFSFTEKIYFSQALQNLSSYDLFVQNQCFIKNSYVASSINFQLSNRLLQRVFNNSEADFNLETLPYFFKYGFFILSIFSRDEVRLLSEADLNILSDNHSKMSMLIFEVLIERINDSGLGLIETLCDSPPNTPTGQETSSSNRLARDLFSFVDLIDIAVLDDVKPKFAFGLLKLFKTLYSTAAKNSETSLKKILAIVGKQFQAKKNLSEQLFKWFSKVVLCVQYEEFTGNDIFCILFKFIHYFCCQQPSLDDAVYKAFNDAMIRFAESILTGMHASSNAFGPDNQHLFFPLIFNSLVNLASISGNSDTNLNGHLKLIENIVKWLEPMKCFLHEKDVIQKIVNETNGKHRIVIEAVHQMISYLSDIFNAFECEYFCKDAEKAILFSDESMLDDDPVGGCSGNTALDAHACLEEAKLNEELCTYTQTKKEFSSQHWYHCNTCNLVDSEGACSVCARVCHDGHDVCYSKYGAFFCDCGAKAVSCLALEKRKTVEIPKVESRSSIDSSIIKNKCPFTRFSKYWFSSTYKHSSKYRYADNYKTLAKKFSNKAIVNAYKNFGLKFTDSAAFQNILVEKLPSLSVTIVDLIECFIPILENHFHNDSDVGFYSRISRQFQELYSNIHSISVRNVPQMKLIGSTKESVFDNMSSSDDEDGGIQLPMGNTVAVMNARTATTSSYLFVVHDRNRISIVDFNQMVSKICESTKSKTVFKRQPSIQLPFMPTNLDLNQYNQRMLSISGPNDCRILQISDEAMVLENCKLEIDTLTYDSILKTIWLPNSHHELAIVTPVSIQIFDLSLKGRQTPVYLLLAPFPNIADATFVTKVVDGVYRRFVLVLTSEAKLFCQELSFECSLDHSEVDSTGFYLMEMFDIDRSSFAPIPGIFTLHYSHCLEMLFLGVNGKESYYTPFNIENCIQVRIDALHPLLQGESDGRWTGKRRQNFLELQSHPGLVFSRYENDIQVFNFTSTEIQKQSINIGPVHSFTPALNVSSTVLISLSSHGSVYVHEALPGTKQWLKPKSITLDPLVAPGLSIGMMKTSSSERTNDKEFNPPVNFFENYEIIDDITYQGDDLLDVYTSAKIKSRLANQSQYVACNKRNGFRIVIVKNIDSHSITGIRVHLGQRNGSRSPSSIHVFGRVILTAPTRPRWFDIPFSEKEIRSINNTKSFTIKFGPSTDPNYLNIVDSILVYGTKDRFAQNESQNKVSPSKATSSSLPSHKLIPALFAPPITEQRIRNQPNGISVVYRFLSNAFDSLESLLFFQKLSESNETDSEEVSTSASHEQLSGKKQRLVDIASRLLIVSLCNHFDRSLCLLLSKALPSRTAYDEHRDEIILKNRLKDFDSSDEITFAFNLAVFRHISTERSKNFIRIVNRYLESIEHVSEDAIEVGLNFNRKLNEIFWRFNPSTDYRCSQNLTQRTHHYVDIKAMLENLIYIHFSLLIASVIPNIETTVFETSSQHLRLIEATSRNILEFLTSSNLVVNFGAKSALQSLIGNNFEEKKTYIAKMNAQEHFRKVIEQAQNEASTSSGPSSNSNRSIQRLERDNSQPGGSLGPSGSGASGSGASARTLRRRNLLNVLQERYQHRHQNPRSDLDNVYAELRSLGNRRPITGQQNVQQPPPSQLGASAQDRSNQNLVARLVQRFVVDNARRPFQIIPDFEFEEDALREEADEDEEDEEDLGDDDDDNDNDVVDDDEDLEDLERAFDDMDDEDFVTLRAITERQNPLSLNARWANLGIEYGALEELEALQYARFIEPPIGMDNVQVDQQQPPAQQQQQQQQMFAGYDSEEDFFNRNNSDEEEQFDESLLDASLESFQSPRSDGGPAARRTFSESSQNDSMSRSTLSSLNVSGASLSRKNSHCPQKIRKCIRKAVLSKFILATLNEMGNSLKTLEKKTDIVMLPFFQTIDKFTDFSFKESDRKEFGRVYSNLCMKMLDYAIENSKNIGSEKNNNAVLYFVLRLLCLFMTKFKHTPNLQLSSMNNDTLDLLKASMNVQNISFGTLLSNRKDVLDPPNLSPSSYSLCLIVAHLLNSSESLFQMCHSALTLILKKYWKHQKPISSKKTSKDVTVAGSTLANNNFNFAMFSTRPILTFADLKPLLESATLKDTDPVNGSLGFGCDIMTEIYLQFCSTLKKMAQCMEQSGDLKLYSGPAWDSAIINLLCEFLSTSSLTDHPIRKLIRRLLGMLCGSKEQYRKMRDYHDIRSRLNSFKESLVRHLFDNKPMIDLDDDDKINKALEVLVNEVFIRAKEKNSIVTSSGIQSVLSHLGIFKFSYSELVQYYDNLIYGAENALERNLNWQELCESDPSILPILFKISLLFEGEIAEVLITLIDTAIFRKNVNQSKDGAKDVCSTLSRNLFSSISSELMSLFIRSFLLESNSFSVRSWAYRLFKHAYEMLTQSQKEEILKILWELVPEVPLYGRRAVEFYDILGHYTLFTQIVSSSFEECEKYYCDILVSLLQHLNQNLAKHPNWSLYNSLQNYIEFNGQHYLETEPCMICNSPEPPNQTYKLSQLKVDARFTVDAVMIKLTGTFSFSKISIKMTEVKKTKQLKTLKVYYNNRAVQNVADLKAPTCHWLLAKSVSVNMNQSEIQINFGLPIVACNLMFRFASFYDILNSTPESAQCPRCSSVVPANPGICNNCGENVFQCHKCRAINYDEKDPFLCHSCGYCRYAKFEYSFTACHAPSAVQRILSDDDRQKAVNMLNVNMEKADKIYHQIVEIRSDLENLLMMSQGCQNTVYCDSTTTNRLGPISQTLNSMNVNIKRIADRYSNDGKQLFEDFSKIVQTVLVTRKELVSYDDSQDASNDSRSEFLTSIVAGLDSPTSSSAEKNERSLYMNDVTFSSTQCFACNSATVRHSISVLTLLSSQSAKFKTKLSTTDLFRELLAYNLRFGSATLREEVRSLLCTLLLHNQKATEEFNRLILNRVKVAMTCKFINNSDFEPIRHEVALFALTFKNADFYWESRIRCAMEIFLLSFKNKSPVVLESVTLPCLKILLNLIEKPAIKDSKDKDTKDVVKFEPQVDDVPQLYEDFSARFSVDFVAFLANDLDHSFFNWQERNKKIDMSEFAKLDPTSEEYNAYSMLFERKYFQKWYFSVKNKKQKRSLKQQLSQVNWMRATLFDPTSKSLRTTVQKLFLIIFERSGNLQKVLIDLLTSCFDGIGEHRGEVATEFFQLFRSIVFPELSFATVSVATTTTSEDQQQSQSQAKQASSASENVSTSRNDWRYYLVIKGIFSKFTGLISSEIQRLRKLEEKTLCSDISQGFILKQLVELLQLFLLDERIRTKKNLSLIGFVLESYLSLRMLIVQRTKMIDDAEAGLLQLMEILIGRNIENTIKFMYLCIEYVEKCSLQDYRTPVFLFERMCSIIYTQEKVADEYFITIDKDSMQEDFLQGRMQGNPYSSKDLGPLMRDIKNKICLECEMLSFLEDDSGLELLVNGKVISLDLTVKEVYKNIVLKEFRQRQANQGSNNAQQARGENSLRENDPTTWHFLRNLNMFALAGLSQETISNDIVNAIQSVSNPGHASGSRPNTNGPVMKVVYRIRGLMGPATEEIVDSFKEKENVVNDDENTYSRAQYMSDNDCAGIQVLLKRLNEIKHLNNRVRQLLDVSLKLFNLTLKIQANREKLIDPKFNSVSILLKIARLLLKEVKPDNTFNEAPQFEQILDLLDILLIEASNKSPAYWDNFLRQSCGTFEDITALMSTLIPNKKSINSILPPNCVPKVLRVCAFLATGDEAKMKVLLDSFLKSLNFEQIDHGDVPQQNVGNIFETTITLFSSIHNSTNGNRFKDWLLKEHIVEKMIDYLLDIAPSSMSVVINRNDWKDFMDRFCPPYILQMLTGLCRNHEKTQLFVAEKAIGVIHNVEKFVLEASLATIAENLMDALKQNPQVAEKIEEVRRMAKEERKRLAMSARTQGVGKMGFKISDSGQIFASEKLLKSVEGQIEVEKGLTCSMCLEGYQCKPQNVLGIYVFTKRVEVEPFERETRKRIGHSTVTHFNLMHFECHQSAIRNARIRDEWNSATMYNASTRCNALLPLWGPAVPQNAFAQCLSKFILNLNEAIGARDFSGTNSFFGFIHDLKLLLLGFSKEVAFWTESGGGARSSNIHLVAHLIHTTLYTIKQIHSDFRDVNKIRVNFLSQAPTDYISSSFTTESPHYWTVFTMLLEPRKFWLKHRLYYLKRLLICEVSRNLPEAKVNAAGLLELSEDPSQVSFPMVKAALMFFYLVDRFYLNVFKDVSENDWPTDLMSYIRNMSMPLVDAGNKLLKNFEEDILVCESFDEFCDAAELLDVIPDPQGFLSQAFQLTPYADALSEE